VNQKDVRGKLRDGYRFSFRVKDYPKEAAEGRADRAVRSVDICLENRLGEIFPLARVRFSANWNPRGFQLETLEPAEGEYAALLRYTVGEGPRSSQGAMKIALMCDARLENLARDLLAL
jgi:hypothetical protein